MQRTLSTTPGVHDAAVNLMMGNATVTYDPSATAPTALVETIRGTGYGAELPVAGRTAFEEQAARDAVQQEEFVTLRRQAIVSGIAGVVAMVVPMMLRDAAWMPYALLVLTFGVILWAGRHFFTSAWAAFRHHAANMDTLVAVGTGAAFMYSVVATLAPTVFTAHGLAPNLYIKRRRTPPCRSSTRAAAAAYGTVRPGEKHSRWTPTERSATSSAFGASRGRCAACRRWSRRSATALRS